jgi:hypothetical protein
MPRSVVECTYVSDVVILSWENLRLRRCKAGLPKSTGESYHALSLIPDIKIEFPAQRWFTDSKAKKEVAEMLRKVGLDEFAIEAEAIRLSSADLERVDRMLLLNESRRNKAFRCIEDYRASFAKPVSNHITESNGVVSLEHQSNNGSALSVASEQQTEANGRNAGKSTGPLLRRWQKARKPQCLSPWLKLKREFGPSRCQPN